jgi:tetratricopeptide (TPR) repeat protein
MPGHGEVYENSSTPSPKPKTSGLAGGDQVDFEIDFYERILESDPCYGEVLRILGHHLTGKGHYNRGLKVDQQLVRIFPRDPVARYNLACSYALLHHNGPALEALRKAIELGYSDLEHLEQDSDLDGLRKDPAYRRLLKECGWM